MCIFSSMEKELEGAKTSEDSISEDSGRKGDDVTPKKLNICSSKYFFLIKGNAPFKEYPCIKDKLYIKRECISGTDSWYEIVKSYDDPMKEPNKRDCGTYSQFSVVMILIYLLFGKDHPYHIKQFFNKPENQHLLNYSRCSVLECDRLSVLLKKMKEDELLIMNKEKDKGKRGPYSHKYKVNPKIIQTLFRNGPHVRKDGLVIELPIEKAEKTLTYFENLNYDEELRKGFFVTTDIPESINFFSFLKVVIMFIDNFIEWRRLVDYQNGSDTTHQQFESGPDVQFHIQEYLKEMKYLLDNPLNRKEPVINRAKWI